MAMYDLPAIIDYIGSVTNQQKMIFIGHSLGTTIFFAFIASHPQYNDRFHAMIALAPVVRFSDVVSALPLVTPFVFISEVSPQLIHGIFKIFLFRK